MPKRISASDAKNDFDDLLEQVAEHGRVDITRHGRLVAVVLAPRLVETRPHELPEGRRGRWGETHMIPPQRARLARMVRPPEGFDDP